MANIELRFLCASYCGSYVTCNKVYDGILIKFSDKDEEFKIYLDKSTAIKFAKTLRTEINKITESEVDNG